MLQRGSLQASLDALHKSLGLSSDLVDSSGDVDVLGAIGDTYTELGDLEKAAEVISPCGVTAVVCEGCDAVTLYSILNCAAGVLCDAQTSLCPR